MRQEDASCRATKAKGEYGELQPDAECNRRQRDRGERQQRDGTTHAARRVWEFRTAPDTYAPFVGSARRLTNGNTFVCFGASRGLAGTATGPIAAYEVRPDGAIKWRLTVGNAFIVYRATPLESIAGEY